VESAPSELGDMVTVSPMQAKQILLAEQGSNQLETAKSEIAALSEGERKALVEDLKEHAIEQKWSARMVLRIESGDLENPMIQGALARLHWKKTRGADWST